MKQSFFDLEVVVNGNTIQEFENAGKTYVEGRENSNFQLSIKNNSSFRVLAIPSIDGLSVMDGELAGYNSSGYIMSAHSSLLIPGWRLSDKKVAKFFFTEDRKSYAETIKKGGNQGIIGVIIFREKVCYISPTVTYFNVFSTNATNFSGIDLSPSITNCASQVTLSSLGTGFGNDLSHKVYEADFEKSSNPEALLEIHYGSSKDLKKWGVYESNKRLIPMSFPRQMKYCVRP